MKHNKAYKLRLYPTKRQEQSFKQSCGNVRWLWNHLLGLNQEQYEKDVKFIFHKEMSAMIPSLKMNLNGLVYRRLAPSKELREI